MATQSFQLTPHTNQTPAVVEIAKELSGAQWVGRFPGSNLESELVEPFKTNLSNFISAMRAAGMTLKINATYRPDKRAFLMHYSGKVATGALAPKDVPTYASRKVATYVDAQDKPEYSLDFEINWDHGDPEKSINASIKMQEGYGTVFPPAYPSKHTARLAVDMWVTWVGVAVEKPTAHFEITIKNFKNEDIVISTPMQKMSRELAAYNKTLHAVGESYGVKKLVSDKPHWSDDGK